jgi:hypothetical protein
MLMLVTSKIKPMRIIMMLRMNVSVVEIWELQVDSGRYELKRRVMRMEAKREVHSVKRVERVLIP